MRPTKRPVGKRHVLRPRTLQRIESILDDVEKERESGNTSVLAANGRVFVPDIIEYFMSRGYRESKNGKDFDEL